MTHDVTYGNRASLAVPPLTPLAAAGVCLLTMLCCCFPCHWQLREEARANARKAAGDADQDKKAMQVRLVLCTLRFVLCAWCFVLSWDGLFRLVITSTVTCSK